ncbi:Uncharacterised protein [Weissella viridescens]|uniref:Uncharacterized protein n=1 Tax=Weissella viridescens TaxID=1629 RepID=A0A380P758_WEIVI|nr:Uncharacterised protein [Weissella viridescens]
MSKVIVHATIYTGNADMPVIEDGFIRFNKTIQDLGSMADFTPKEGDETMHMEQKLLFLALSMCIRMVPTASIQWMVMSKTSCKWFKGN